MVKTTLVETLLCKSADDGISRDAAIDMENETLWVTEKTIAELFNTSANDINRYLNEMFEAGELVKDEVMFDSNGESDIQSELYNLDVIISLGYRINNKEAMEFRKWLAELIKTYMVKGFVLDDELLKNSTTLGKNYFDELIEKIQEIRASKRSVYQKITDIFMVCSYDYDKESAIAEKFYLEFQNRLSHAATYQTPGEQTNNIADNNKENMGLTTWINGPEGKILKSHVPATKNYMVREEITKLKDMVDMHLDYAENQARNHKLMTMKDWAERLKVFLEFDGDLLSVS